MRTVIQILCVLLLVFGALTTPLGLVALLYAKLAPVQPPPSLNEGPGLGELIGSCVTALGFVSGLLGFALRAGLRSKPDSESDPAWARRHKRLL